LFDSGNHRLNFFIFFSYFFYLEIERTFIEDKMATYITALDLWKSLGKGSYTKVRAENLGTGDGSVSSWSLDHDNVITDSTTIYTDSTVCTTSTINLDDGEITNLTASSEDVVTADYSYADIPDSYVQEILKRADEYLTNSTGRIFATTSTTEYIDVEDRAQNEYFLTHWPVITISSMQVNTKNVGDAPSWSSSTQGLGNDFIANADDLKVGRFRWIDNFPPSKGVDRLKVTYVHGYTETPEMVKELATLLATRMMIQSTMYQTIFKGRDSSSPINLDVVDKRIEELIRKIKRIDINKP